MIVKFGKAEFTVRRVNETVVLRIRAQIVRGFIDVEFGGTTDEAEALKNAIEEADSVRTQPR